MAFVNCLALDALDVAKQPLSATECDPMLKRVHQRQLPDGSWPCLATGGASAFETAWAVRLLMRVGRGPSALRAIAKGIEWLVLHQLEDGSWPTRPILRIPRGDDFQPWECPGWSMDARRRFGVVLADSSRCFTTSAALGALAAMTARFGDRKINSQPVSL
jgi:hypothetical protein